VLLIVEKPSRTSPPTLGAASTIVICNGDDDLDRAWAAERPPQPAPMMTTFCASSLLVFVVGVFVSSWAAAVAKNCRV